MLPRRVLESEWEDLLVTAVWSIETYSAPTKPRTEIKMALQRIFIHGVIAPKLLKEVRGGSVTTVKRRYTEEMRKADEESKSSPKSSPEKKPKLEFNMIY